MRRSPNYQDGVFKNTAAARTFPPGSRKEVLREFRASKRHRKPVRPVPVVPPARPNDGGESAGPHVTWFGHSSALVEIDGRRVLIDPVWGERCSPSRLLGPRRLHRPPVPLRRLPTLDAIVVSHDHYDHLDAATVRVLAAIQSAPFVVPLGVGAHLERWGVPARRVIELDWHESVGLSGLTVTATPARHFSGRSMRRDTTLWASWVISGASGKIFYSGDTGYSESFAEIGAAYGPFDATLMQIGAYGVGWPDIHLTPEEGVTVHRDVRGGLLIPVHWGTFTLAPHAWAEPIERLVPAAEARGVALAVPRPGERVDVTAPPALTPWWRATAADAGILAVPARHA